MRYLVAVIATFLIDNCSGNTITYAFSKRSVLENNSFTKAQGQFIEGTTWINTSPDPQNDNVILSMNKFVFPTWVSDQTFKTAENRCEEIKSINRTSNQEIEINRSTLLTITSSKPDTAPTAHTNSTGEVLYENLTIDGNEEAYTSGSGTPEIHWTTRVTAIHIMDERPVRPSTEITLDRGLLSKAQQADYIQVVQGLKMVLHTVALLMTLLATVSFIRAKTQSRSTTFIIALNIFEFITAFLSLVGYLLNYGFGGWSKVILLYNQTVSMYIVAVCRRIVYVLNLMMSGQRLIVVALPFASRTVFRHSINMAVILTVVLVVFAAHVYVPLGYVVVQRGNGLYRLAYSSLYRTHVGQFEMAATASKFVFAFGPLTVSLLANVMLLANLRRKYKKAEKLHASQNPIQAPGRKERQMTKMVLMSSLLFTLLCLPANVHLLVSTYTAGYGFYQREHYLFLLVHEVFLGLLPLGDIANFLSYLLLSSAFRKQMNATFDPIFRHCKLVKVTARRSTFSSTAAAAATSSSSASYRLPAITTVELYSNTDSGSFPS